MPSLIEESWNPEVAPDIPCVQRCAYVQEIEFTFFHTLAEYTVRRVCGLNQSSCSVNPGHLRGHPRLSGFLHPADQLGGGSVGSIASGDMNHDNLPVRKRVPAAGVCEFRSQTIEFLVSGEGQAAFIAILPDHVVERFRDHVLQRSRTRGLGHHRLPKLIMRSSPSLRSGPAPLAM